MKIINAHKVLRHQPPFRFIDSVTILNDNRAVAQIVPGQNMKCWAADMPLSALPIEYAAQVMGVLIRTKLGVTQSVGVLAGVTKFDWDYLAVPLASVEVKHTGTRGNFHDFKAIYFDSDGLVCACLRGFIHLAPKSTDGNVVVTAPVPAQEGPLYYVTKFHAEDFNAEMGVQINPSCPVFAGHFPNDPITPGVLIVEMMLAAAQRLFVRPMGLRAIKDLTFKAPLLPGDTALVRLKSIGKNRFSTTLMRNGKRMARAKFMLDCLPSAPLTTKENNETKTKEITS